MPRGGGFGGGGGRGFGGGGFGGGGFRGGGHRGSSGGFRSGGSGSHPFGRTGASRSVSRPPSGNNYYRHGHRHGYYGGWGYRPYWYRPWYARHYWWWGNPYGSWYYSPVYVGGGFILFILLLLLIIPLIGLATIPYPSSSSQTITYNDTQTISFNEYWYESEYLSAGNKIDYLVQSQEPTSFAIASHSFDQFPIAHTGNSGTNSFGFNVNPNEDYQYVTYYLYQGDTLQFDYTTSGNIEFFIADGPNLKSWNNYESAQLYQDAVVNGPNSGSFSAPHSQDWYLVWYNSATSGPAITVSTNIDYSISSVDMSGANFQALNTVLVPQGTYTVPTSGTYYFFIYFDPTNSPAEKTDITFTIVYNKDLTSNDSWKQSSPLLTILAVIIIILLIVALVQRNNAKKYEKQRKEKEAQEKSAQPTPGVSPSTISSQTQTVQVQASGSTSDSTSTSTGGKNRCHVCGNAYFDTDVYCNACGTKLIGRDYGVPKQTTPTGSKNCSVCGTYLQPGAKFCPDCGTQVK